MPYEKPPVVFVAFEVRFPSEDSASRPTVTDQRDLRGHLEGKEGDSWIVERLTTGLQLSFGAPGVLQSPLGSSSTGLPQLVNRARTTSVTFAPASVIVETTSYQSWTQFKSLLRVVIEFVADRLQPDGYSRLGLRYLDEIEAPLAPDEQVDWRNYLNSTLPPPPPADFREQTWQSVAQYGAEGDRGLILRYGPAAVPLALGVPGTGLKRRTPGDGPHFIVDTDAFIQPGTIPMFEAPGILDTLESLHDPISVLFESLVKPELRALWT